MGTNSLKDSIGYYNSVPDTFINIFIIFGYLIVGK